MQPAMPFSHSEPGPGRDSLDLPAAPSSQMLPARRHLGEMPHAWLTCLELTSYPTQATMPAGISTFLPRQDRVAMAIRHNHFGRCNAMQICSHNQLLPRLSLSPHVYIRTAIPVSTHHHCLFSLVLYYIRMYCLFGLIQPLYCTSQQGFREL
jgi:hypothetical protein